MARLLVKALDFTNPDGEKDRRGAWKKGYIVSVHEDGTVAGNKETLPKFVWLDVASMSVSEGDALRGEWNHEFTLETTEHDLDTDRLRVRLKQPEELTGKNDQCVVTAAKLATFAGPIKATVVSEARNDVVLEYDTAQAAAELVFPSRKRGEGDVVRELSYDRVTGLHTMEVVSGGRTRTLQYKAEDVRDRLNFRVPRTVYARARYRISPTLVDTAIAAGGVLAVRKSVLMANITDKAQVDD